MNAATISQAELDRERGFQEERNRILIEAYDEKLHLASRKVPDLLKCEPPVLVDALRPMWRNPTGITKDQLRAIKAPVMMADGEHDERQHRRDAVPPAAFVAQQAECRGATTAHEDLDPIAVLQTVYPMVEALARARGLDPDAPRHLAKVTRTR